MGVAEAGYTTINVYPEDRDRAKQAKQDGETWSEFLRRAADLVEAVDAVEENETQA